MSFFEIVMLAFALAMDATAVAGARGLVARNLRIGNAVLLASLFGGFQAAMPAMGSLVGVAIAKHVEQWSHWIVFLILVAIGGKMMRSASGADTDERKNGNPFALGVLLLLAIATSIDALAAGVTLGLHGANVPLACAVIGLVTASLSFAGVYAGRRFGAVLGNRLEIVGGLTLIGLGVKGVLQHYL
jgi:putative Mn2+ efflux pump MntP